MITFIQAIPGCLDYDLVRLSGWFGSRRQRLRLKERKEQGPHNNDSRKWSGLSDLRLFTVTAISPFCGTVCTKNHLNRFSISDVSCYPTSDCTSK